jgi:hypothetical protein
VLWAQCIAAAVPIKRGWHDSMHALVQRSGGCRALLLIERVEVSDHVMEAGDVQVGVDLGGLDAGMAQQFLQHAQGTPTLALLLAHADRLSEVRYSIFNGIVRGGQSNMAVI